jgi:lipoprotein-anchoring transpeptidase ErfK/SrfK
MQATKEFTKQAVKIAILITALILSGSAPAQEAPSPAAPHEFAAPARQIVVSIADRKLALVENGEVKAMFSIAVGKEGTPSPAGSFHIVNRVVNPTYYHEGKVIPPGPCNPVGTRWLGLSEHGYGIHGTNAPHSIGKAASHGCIRMARTDLEQLFAMVAVGDAVEIHAERDEETERFFGAAEGSAERTELADAVPDVKSIAN